MQPKLIRYPLKTSPYSSHSVILKQLGMGNGRKLLDVGCADGSLSLQFISMGWRVVGIEPFGGDAQAARLNGLEIVEKTVEHALDELDTKFDAIVLADVLEHFADPWDQLRSIVELCHPNATVLISLPNVANFVTRVQLLFGRFDYVERGILDRTHLRFFTQASAVDLVTSAGLDCNVLIPTPTPVELIYPRLTSNYLGRGGLKINAALARAVPRFFGYQFVMSCSIRST